MVKLTGHAFKQYDEDLLALFDSLERMGEKVGMQLAMIRRALEGAGELRAEVKAIDKEVNALDRSITTQIQMLLTRYHSTEEELRYVLSSLKIASALENLGDLSKATVRRLEKLETPVPDHARDALAGMLALVADMLPDCLKLVRRYDAEKAVKLTLAERDTDAMYLDIFQSLQEMAGNAPADIRLTGHVLLLAKNLERMADQLFSILKIAYFIETGEKFSRKKLLQAQEAATGA